MQHWHFAMCLVLERAYGDVCGMHMWHHSNAMHEYVCWRVCRFCKHLKCQSKAGRWPEPGVQGGQSRWPQCVLCKCFYCIRNVSENFCPTPKVFSHMPLPAFSQVHVSVCVCVMVLFVFRYFVYLCTTHRFYATFCALLFSG